MKPTRWGFFLLVLVVSAVALFAWAYVKAAEFEEDLRSHGELRVVSFRYQP